MKKYIEVFKSIYKIRINIKTETYHIQKISVCDKYILKEKKSILDFKITLGNYDSFLDQIMILAKSRTGAIICVANVHMFVEAFKDKKLLKVLNDADIVTPDGRPLVWSLRLLYGIRQDRVCGMDLLPDLLKRLMKEHLPVYFLGGSEELLEQSDLYFKKHYSNLKVAGMYSPPYRALTETESEEIIDDINQSEAAIVFFVLGCPKQERLMATLKGRVKATMIGIGGALPVMIGEKRRAPKWMQLYGFEWLFRFVQEPRRLFKRYTSTNFFFLYLITKEIVRKKVLRKSAHHYN